MDDTSKVSFDKKFYTFFKSKDLFSISIGEFSIRKMRTFSWLNGKSVNEIVNGLEQRHLFYWYRFYSVRKTPPIKMLYEKCKQVKN